MQYLVYVILFIILYFVKCIWWHNASPHHRLVSMIVIFRGFLLVNFIILVKLYYLEWHTYSNCESTVFALDSGKVVVFLFIFLFSLIIIWKLWYMYKLHTCIQMVGLRCTFRLQNWTLQIFSFNISCLCMRNQALQPWGLRPDPTIVCAWREQCWWLYTNVLLLRWFGPRIIAPTSITRIPLNLPLIIEIGS